MPTDQTRNVSLTAELNAFIRAQVVSASTRTPVKSSAPDYGSC
jgi:hypothetical protein